MPAPSDETLRDFLLGTLPPDAADGVRHWLESDPANVTRLARFTGRDLLLDAIATDRTHDPAVTADAVERVTRRVTDSHRSFAAETPADADTHGGTIPQLISPLTPPGVWPPTRLGQFRVLRELGHGGMGYVFEAEDETLGRRVAVKVLTPELVRNPAAAARFLREARAAARVDHDNVVPVLHVGEQHGTPFMVMPLLAGEALSDRVGREPLLSGTEVERIGRDVASGLNAAHAKGLVHRDLKPQNVWLDAGTGRARVLDFGLAKLGDGSDALTQVSGLAGTPAYMAPELLDGQPATVHSDLFALGAVLYECATGRRAFPGATITAILKAVTDHHPAAPREVNPGVSPRLSALVMRMLSKNSLDRPASAAEVLAALAAPYVPPPEPKRPSRRLLIGAIAISVCLLVAVGYAVTRPGHQPEPAPLPAERPADSAAKAEPPTVPKQYRGKVELQLARKNGALMPLKQVGALPMRNGDEFRIEVEVDPPAYLYLMWIDPDRDLTPMYPWNPIADDWKGTRPPAADEKPRGKLSLPTDAERWYVREPKPGVVTAVVFACERRLDESDEVIEGWFKGLPEFPLPTGRDDRVIWFRNYIEDPDPLRLRTGFNAVEASQVELWQRRLKKTLAGREVFQASVSFARR